MRITITSLRIVVIAILVTSAACGSQTTDDPVGSAGTSTSMIDMSAPDRTTSTTVAASTAERAWRIETLIDRSRSTEQIVDAGGEIVLAASDERRIPVWLLYPGRAGGGPDAAPAATGPRPLVVWLNGLGGTAAPGDPVPLALGDAGFVVALPNPPEISEPVSSITGYPLLPADTSALLDALADPHDGFADDLAAVVDLDRVGVVGHSIGASGALALTSHECCRDERIDAAVAFGASLGFAFEETPFDFGDRPLLLVHGEDDQLAALADAEEIRSQSPSVSLLPLLGADHFEPVYGGPDSESASLARRATVSFLEVHVAETKPASVLDEIDLVHAVDRLRTSPMPIDWGPWAFPS